jgi:hypothetical protein
MQVNSELTQKSLQSNTDRSRLWAGQSGRMKKVSDPSIPGFKLLILNINLRFSGFIQLSVLYHRIASHDSITEAWATCYLYGLSKVYTAQLATDSSCAKLLKSSAREESFGGSNRRADCTTDCC